MSTQLDIRDIVLKNLSGSSAEEIKGYIQDTIDNKEDDALPGMGILFEVIWQKSEDSEKDSMMQKIIDTI